MDYITKKQIKMKKLLLLATVLILTACSKTGVQVINESEATLYHVEVYYFDKDGAILNSYLVSDSIAPNQKSKNIDIENRADYANIKYNMVSDSKIAECKLIRDSIAEISKMVYNLYDDRLKRMDEVLNDGIGKIIANKYYIEEGRITYMVINNSSRIYK